jgi:prevent-host-death family protein
MQRIVGIRYVITTNQENCFGVRYDVPLYFYSCTENTSMQTITASEARANLYRLIDETAESHQPIAITGKRTNAVLLSAEDWSAIQETLYLLSVPGMRESITAGMMASTEECSKELDW